MHHFTESGLDNVWLQNGYTVKQTAYGEGVAVADVDELLDTLANWLIKKPGRLTGKELRFMRTFLLLSQANLAIMLGATEQSVSLWERTGKVPKSSDALIRLIVLEKLKGNDRVSEVIDRINTMDRQLNQQIIARSRMHRWSAKAQSTKPGLHA